MKSLNKIARINKGESDIISLEDIDSVIVAQKEQYSQFNLISLSATDLCQYKSLRIVSLSTAIFIFGKRYVKFGPLILIDQLGLNIFLNQAVMGAA